MHKLLITKDGENVAPRFDLANEVQILTLSEEGEVLEEREFVLPRASAEELCRLILREDARVVICGGIEGEYYDYLIWKKVEVYDAVIGPYAEALAALGRGELVSGAILARELL